MKVHIIMVQVCNQMRGYKEQSMKDYWKKWQRRISELLARLESNEKQLQATDQLVQQMMQWMNFQHIDLQPTTGDQVEDEGASDDGEESKWAYYLYFLLSIVLIAY